MQRLAERIVFVAALICCWTAVGCGNPTQTREEATSDGGTDTSGGSETDTGAGSDTGTDTGSDTETESNYGMNITIEVVPFQGVDKGEISNLIHDLGFLGAKMVLRDEIPLPQNGYDQGRGQYRASALLQSVESVPGDHLLGITHVDLYEGSFNFVFGLARYPGRAGVVSLFRLRSGGDAQTFRDRAVKESVHEMGHTFGLAHCSDARCVMHFSNSIANTDDKDKFYCNTCRQQISNLFN